jgi:hypothetical protein
MLVTITNLASTPTFISMLYKSLAASGATGSTITVSKSYSELDQESTLKSLVAAGTVSLSFAAEANDAVDIGIADNQVVRFYVSGTIATGTQQGGAWEAPAAGVIRAVTAYVKTTGDTSGATTVDVNIAGTTIFTTQANRPSIAYDDADGKAAQTTIENSAFTAGALITVDVDAIPGGTSSTELTVVITVDYTAG